MKRVFLKAAIIGWCLTVVSVAAPAFAHHATAMFDGSKTATIKGTIDQFQWTNPHVIIWVAVDAEGADQPQLWAVELSAPGALTRQGWTKRSVKPGDKVSVDLSPLRNGKPGGLFKKITLLDTGQVLTFSLLDQAKP